MIASKKAVQAMNANGARVAEGGPAAGEATVADLVMRARSGDQRAWDAIVERYAPLVWSICRRYRLSGADTDDAGQAVWLQLVDQIDRIRDPAALPGWLATTTRRECGRIVRAAHRAQPPGYVLDADKIPDEQTGTADDELLVAARPAGPSAGTRRLPARWQLLSSL